MYYEHKNKLRHPFLSCCFFQHLINFNNLLIFFCRLLCSCLFYIFFRYSSPINKWQIYFFYHEYIKNKYIFITYTIYVLNTFIMPYYGLRSSIPPPPFSIFLSPFFLSLFLSLYLFHSSIPPNPPPPPPSQQQPFIS